MKNSDMPAMPFVEPDHPGSVYPGLTKREHFAAMAMQGLLASAGRNSCNSIMDVIAESAIAADALLAELDRTK